MNSVSFSNYNCTNYKIYYCVGVLSALVAAAGLAIAGCALLGPIPSNYFYVGTGCLCVGLISLAVLAAVYFLKSKKEENGAVVQQEPEQAMVVHNDPSSDLPDEVLVSIFTCLEEKEISNASRVCKRWRHLSRDSAVCSTLLAKGDWQESQPDIKRAMRALTSLKYPPRTPRVFPFHINGLVEESKSACSGNYLVFFTAPTVHVWMLNSASNKTLLSIKCKRAFNGHPIRSIGYFGHLVYLGLNDGNMLLWNIKENTTTTWQGVHPSGVEHISVSQQRIITQSQGQCKIWNRETHTLVHSVNSVETLYAYQDKVVSTDGQNVVLLDSELNTEKTCINMVGFGTIDFVQEYNGALIIQVRRENSRWIELHSLETKKLISGQQIGPYQSVLCAVSGLIVTKSQGYPKHEIIDFR